MVSVSPCEEKGTNFTNRREGLVGNRREFLAREKLGILLLLLWLKERHKGFAYFKEMLLLLIIRGALNGGVLITVAIFVLEQREWGRDKSGEMERGRGELSGREDRVKGLIKEGGHRMALNFM